MKNGGLFSWMRGKGRQQSQPAEPAQEKPSAEAAPAHPEAARPTTELELPPEHPLMRLWELWQEETGSPQVPRLSLTLPDTETPVIPPENMGRELYQLEKQLEAAAAKRLERVLPGGWREPLHSEDAEVVVYVPRDQLSAWVIVYPPGGSGRALNQKMLSEALERERISFGVDRELLERLPDQRDCYFSLRMVARGRLPVHGKDGYVEELFPRTAERKYVVNEQNQVDYTALNLVQNVNKGDVICRITPPSEGTPGKPVRGEDIPARSGKTPEVPKGRNTALSEDGRALVALMSGHVQFTGRGFEIRTILDIFGDVDFSTSNLNHLGDIHIHGDVRSGFTVRAMGSVTVDGVIEDTSVEAGGDLIVRGGVQGNGRAVVRSHQNIYARYLESCDVYAKGDLNSDCVISCNIYCDGSLQVTTGHGSIVGGRIRAGGSIRAVSVGARSEIRTEITLGGHPCEDVEREEVLRELQDMERDWAKIERQPESPAKQKRLSDLRLKTTISRMKLEKFKKSLDHSGETGEAAENLSSQLTAETVFPGTILLIGSRNLAVKDEMRFCTAGLRNGEVRFF